MKLSTIFLLALLIGSAVQTASAMRNSLVSAVQRANRFRLVHTTDFGQPIYFEARFFDRASAIALGIACASAFTILGFDKFAKPEIADKVIPPLLLLCGASFATGTVTLLNHSANGFPVD